MSYYDSDCFWTNEELGRKRIEDDNQRQGLICWLKQLLIYVVDLEDHVFVETNSQVDGHSLDGDDNQNSFRAKSVK